MQVHLLDYGAGNVRSVLNALKAAGYSDIIHITGPSDLKAAKVVVFPGVGSFGSAMASLEKMGVIEALKEYINAGGHYFGVCLGMQTLFESSQETPGVQGLGIIPGPVEKFVTKSEPVPCIGWNEAVVCKESPVQPGRKYFVHSYRAAITEANKDWVSTTSTYGGETYISSVRKGGVFACQFHPEKSGASGIATVKAYLDSIAAGSVWSEDSSLAWPVPAGVCSLSRRVVAALDVRSNDAGDLVVTKGDQYDVREKSSENHVRNLGKPVGLASKYYEDGIDELAFLNITSFRMNVLEDLPLVDLLQAASETIFVPMTVGGGIRAIKAEDGKVLASAGDVASLYFRAGADKVSIGSDAVAAVEQLIANNGVKDGSTSIEEISEKYGVQATVVSIDPKRVYVEGEEEKAAVEAGHTVVTLDDGRKCWWQCTVKGGREARNLDALALAKGVADLGCGEIMANCIDSDGQCSGFDVPLMKLLAQNTSIPIIASSGAGCGQHFVDVFEKTGVSAALAAGIFHRNEVTVGDVKMEMQRQGIPTRM